LVRAPNNEQPALNVSIEKAQSVSSDRGKAILAT
jgi:hypothetical protein